MLSVRNLAKQLGGFRLKDVSFDVPNGDYCVVLGASGAGKTVLLETIAGINPPDAGAILWDGVDITRERVEKRRMGLVYQDQALFPHMSVRRNIAYGLRAHGMRGEDLRQRVETLAAQVGVEGMLNRYPGTLSGGEAQRVALARAMATAPRCLLLDEPLSSLDMGARAAMRALLRGLNRQGFTVIHVTHDYEEAIALASSVAVMERGTVVQTGTPREIFHHPKSEFVAKFVGIRNFVKGVLETPRDGAPGLAHFIANGLTFSILTDAAAGPGRLLVHSEDIAVAAARYDTSAQNTFRGRIADIAPARLGIEVTVDIGVELAALITEESVQRFHLECGQEVWISFKATAARFIEE